MKNDKIYVICYDRGNRAQDNGEHFCRWIMKNHPEIETGYILNRNSSDWDRLEKEGFNLIDTFNREYVNKELKLCDYACSSIFNEGINLNFNGCNCKRVFLNHGCFLVPINYVRDEYNKVDLFIAANQIEYDTLLDPYHRLTEDQVALCGQPRHDDLINLQLAPHEEDTILIQFWQRPWEWSRNNDRDFLRSRFYKRVSELLSSNRLLEFCRKNKLKIVFKMHPIQYDFIGNFKKFENDIVRVSYLSEPFEPLFIRSKMIITDISSNAYEMAKIGKPCIYFEPDYAELFGWRRQRNGQFEFNLKENSIGPIIYDSADACIDKIFELASNNYKLDKLYLDRRKDQISFLNDNHNCERCFDAMMNITRSRTSEIKDNGPKKFKSYLDLFR